MSKHTGALRHTNTALPVGVRVVLAIQFNQNRVEGEGVRPRTIARLLHKTQAHVGVELTKLVRSGVLRRVGRGRYLLATGVRVGGGRV